MVQGQYRNVSTATFSAITLYPIIRKKKDIGKKRSKQQQALGCSKTDIQ